MWSIPSGGGPAALFNSYGAALIGGVLAPSSFGTYAGSMFITLSGNGDFVNTSTGTTEATVQSATVATSGWASAVAAPSGFGSIGGDILIADDGQNTVALLTPGDVGGVTTTFATLPISPFGLAFAPSGFGAVSGELLATDANSNLIYAVSSSGAASLFATPPAGATLRQLAFAPSGFGIDGGDLFVSGNGGAIYVVNSTGATVATLTAASLGITGSFNSRGFLFTDSQHLLLSNYGAGQLDLISTAPTVPEPTSGVLAGLALLGLLGARKMRRR